MHVYPRFLFLILYTSFILEEVEATCKCWRSENTLHLRCDVPKEQYIQECFQNNTDAKRVFFMDSALRSIPSSITLLSNVTYLNFANNSISDIDNTTLNSFGNTLEILILDYNKIKLLGNRSLDKLIKLQELHLKENCLENIETDALSENLISLRNLQIPFNRLSIIDASIAFLPQVFRNESVRVNISNNLVSNVTNYRGFKMTDFSSNNSLYVDLTSNNFTTIDVQYFTKLFDIHNLLELYKLGNCGFNINYNPIVCDCNLFDFAFYINLFRPLDPYNQVFAMTCYNPPSLSGRRVFNVPLNDFNCSVDKDCPRNCDCHKTAGLNILTVICKDNANFPDEIPSWRKIHLAVHNSSISELDDEYYFSNVSFLDASFNSISKLSDEFLHRLETIEMVYLHDNSIEYFPESIQKYNLTGLRTITLHNNPYICDCHSIWFKSWLINNNDKIQSNEKVVCTIHSGDKIPIIKVPDELFSCKNEVGDVSLLLVFIGIVIFVTIMMVLLGFIFRNQIKLLFVNHCKWWRGAVRTINGYQTL